MDLIELIRCCHEDGRRLALIKRVVALGKGVTLMDIFQFIQIAGFGLAFFMAGYTLGKRK